ncbi:MAG: hypothetical protein LBK70_00085 [Clostridiales bacterium]|jgi:energy-coupling factor transporter transmembrane protein EcfT|nr:hypothetical protein [Clostridiales bacterium]
MDNCIVLTKPGNNQAVLDMQFRCLTRIVAVAIVYFASVSVSQWIWIPLIACAIAMWYFERDVVRMYKLYYDKTSHIVWAVLSTALFVLVVLTTMILAYVPNIDYSQFGFGEGEVSRRSWAMGSMLIPCMLSLLPYSWLNWAIARKIKRYNKKEKYIQY